VRTVRNLVEFGPGIALSSVERGLDARRSPVVDIGFTLERLSSINRDRPPIRK